MFFTAGPIATSEAGPPATCFTVVYLYPVLRMLENAGVKVLCPPGRSVPV